MPTKPWSETSSDTPRSTASCGDEDRGRYENQTSAARSNAHTCHGASPECRKTERLLVRPIEEVLDSPEHLDATFDGPAAANVPDLIAGRVEQSPECSESRFDVEVVSAPSATKPGGQQVREAPSESNDHWWRGRRSSGSPGLNGGGAARKSSTARMSESRNV